MNVKQGDLAIQIRSNIPENVGRILEVISLWGTYGGDVFWNVKSANPIRVVTIFGKVEVSQAGEIVQTRDMDLRPISGLPDTEDSDTKEPIKEVA